MFFNNKSEFAETLSDQFRMSANWRTAQAKKYTHDIRNAEAAHRLRELKSQIVIPESVWDKLTPLVSDPVCLSVISETNREVSFRKHPTDFAAWLDNLLSNLMSVAA